MRIVKKSKKTLFFCQSDNLYYICIVLHTIDTF